jgi:hypothetical protein
MSLTFPDPPRAWSEATPAEIAAAGPYQAIIAEYLPEDSPIEARHVEALMRLEWGVLDARPRSDFRRYTGIALDFHAQDPTLLDSLARSYNL